MKALRVDKREKVILIELKTYYQQHNIVINYTTLYLLIKNDLLKRRQKIFIMIKDSLLINRGLLFKL